MRFRISDQLSLPADAVTETFAILAKRGAGKTYTASVFVEELADAGMQVAVVDPIGVWWGLRSSADGKSAGIPIVVLGGDHGDVPLEPTGGALVADLIVDEALSVVLDLGRFRKGEQIRFMTDFAERLYHRNRSPLHLVLDEADAFAPQKPRPEGARLLGAIEDLVRRGRARGIGVSLVTQRSAVLNKDVLTQAEVLVALRTTHPRDRDAIEEWARAHGTPEQLDELRSSLAGLPVGEAWFWSPGWLDVFKRVRIRERRTFDSSATPRPGEKPRQPRTLADVDLRALQERMAATIEKAKEDDPRELRRQIAELRRRVEQADRKTALLEQATAERPAAETVVERVEVPVLKPGNTLETVLLPVLERMPSLLERTLEELRQLRVDVHNYEGGPDATAAARNVPRVQERDRSSSERVAARAPARRPRRSSVPGVGDPAGDVQIKAGARRILETLARHHPMRVTRAQLGTLAKFKISGGTFQTYFSLLKREGLIDESGGDIGITDRGLDHVGHVPAAPQTTEELIEMWRGSLKAGARRMLDELVAVYPRGIHRDDLAELLEMAESGGTFQTYVSTLRRNGLAEVTHGVVSASDTLFLRGAA